MSWARDTVFDVRNACNRARRHIVFTALAVTTLALGIAACETVFAVFESVLVRRLPLPGSDHLVWVGVAGAGPDELAGPTPAQAAAWRSRMRSLSGLALYDEHPVTLIDAARPEAVLAATVDGSFFAALGARARLGRTLNSSDDVPDAAPVAVLSDALWRGRFAADPHVVGRLMRSDVGEMQIVGVMPPTFDLPAGGVQMWTPLFARFPFLVGSAGVHTAGAVGRLRGLATADQAARELASIAGVDRTPGAARGGSTGRVRVVSLQAFLTGAVKPVLVLMLGASVGLLFVACANVASLLFVRAADRGREIVVRRALGAARGRLVRQLVVECALLVAIAAVAATAAVWVAMPIIRAWAAPRLPRSVEIGVHASSLAWVVVVVVASTFAVGLAPALAATSRPSMVVDRYGSLVGAGRRWLDPRGLVVTAEIAMTLLLLTGTAVLARSVALVVGASSGFDPSHVVSAGVMRPLGNYPKDKQPVRDFAAALLEEMSRFRSVRAAAIALLQPTEAWARGTVRLTNGTTMDSTLVSFQVVTPQYFRVLGIPLLDGRDFDDRDVAGREPTVILSARVARRLAGTVRASDRSVTARSNPPDSTPYESYRVVGVVGDVSPPGPARDPIPLVYIPFAREPVPHMTVLLQTRGASPRIERELRAAVRAIDPGQAVSSIRSLDDVLAESTAAPRFYLTVLGAFSVVAVALAAIGVYAVTLLGWRQREREMGIRLALGATPGDLVRLVLYRNARAIVIGTAAGLLAALASTRLLRSLLSGISTTDPLSFVAAASLLSAVAALAAYVAARGVSGADPLKAITAD